MPPRKSNISQITATGEDCTPLKEKEGINIEDLSLPRTMVQRLAKGVLPPNTQIQKDAITAMSKGATVFVNYLSQAANASTQSTSRKAITPASVILALHELEFSDFVPRLEAELAKYIEVQTGKRNVYRQKLKEKAAGAAVDGEGEVGVNGGGGEEEGRKSKRVRRDEGREAVEEDAVEEEEEPVVEEEEPVEEEEEDDESEGKASSSSTEGEPEAETMEGSLGSGGSHQGTPTSASDDDDESD